MTGRKTVTTTHGRYTVDGSMSEKTIKMMMAPYERLISIHDAETGEEITGRENAEEESGDALLLIADYEHVEPRGEESPVATVRGTPALCVTSPGDSPIGRGDGSAKTPATRTADLDPVPHPCTTSPGPCRRSVLLKRSEVRPYAEHVGTGGKR